MTTRRNFHRAAKRISRLHPEMKEPLKGALYQIGNEMMTDVKASRPGHGVPRDTGALAASGRVSLPRPDNTVLLSFGDFSSPYALIQHERLDFYHPVGEARYLVRGVDRWGAASSGAIAALKAQTRAAVRRVSRMFKR